MKIITRVLAVLAFAGWTGSVTAASIGPVDIISADGKEWAQVDLFTGLSWNDIEAVCPAGDCDAGTGDLLNGWSVEGYLWASVEDINDLFNNYLGAAGVTGTDLLGTGPDLYDENSSDWADDYFADGWRATAASFTSEIVAGWSSSDSQRINEAFSPNFAHSIDGGFNDSVNTTVDNIKGVTSQSIGGWFYRSGNAAGVPAPATHALFALGLMGLGWARRKKA